MKLSDYAKLNSITYKTAWRHFKKGLIPGAKQLPTGTVVIPDETLSNSNREERVGIYSRVSSSQNKGNLETQTERIKNYCFAKGYVVHKVVKEIGSGLNDQRPKLKSLLQDESVTRIVVEHKDRITRFGFNYIQDLLTLQGREIEVINLAEEVREDLMQDLISIITSFVARYYGRRRSQRKTEQIIQIIQEAGE